MTAAVGPISLAVERARVTLADCAAFRTLVGATSQAQALSRIHVASPPTPANKTEHTLEELQRLRPYATVWADTDGSLTLVRDTHDAYTPAEVGRIMILIERDVPTNIKDNPAEIETRCLNDMGQVMTELMTLAGGADYLDIQRIDGHGPVRSPDDDRAEIGDFLAYQMECEWGQTHLLRR